MRAMVYRGPYKVRVEEKDVPPIEHPNDAIVRVQLGAICGSDLHLYHGMMPDTRVGMTFGHEFIGTVHEVGSSVRNLKPGDRVMVPFNIYCGSCFFCARGLYSNCHNTNPNHSAVGGIYGYSHTTGGDDGSPVALNWAIDSVRKGATVSVMGAFGPLFSAVKFGDAMNKGLTLRMNQCPVKRQWPRLFEHVRNGYLKPSDIVTHRIPLEHIAEGYYMFSAKLDGCIKPLVVPNGA